MTYLLTGNRTEAEDLLQAALARTYVRWQGIRDKGAADAYVRRAMVNLASRQWRTRGREVAAELGCSVGAVKSQTHHALRRLRTALGEPVLSTICEEPS